jgi:hypothetical protein
VHEIAPYARRAFAYGWAASGGPMTDRVKRACRVAVEMACEHPEDVDVFEVTLKLGSLEGTWARVYDRRESLWRKHTEDTVSAWRPVAATLPVGMAVTRFRRSAGIAEANDPQRADLAAKALAAAKWLLHQVGDDPTTPEYLELVRVLADSIKTGMAEGEAGAIALAAQDSSIIGIDFDIAFKDAWKQLEKLGEYYADAKGWLGRILNGAATDVGRLLAQLAEQGATYDQMVSEISDLLDSNEIRSVATMVDMAMGQSFSRGALALYAREGIREVDFYTAGDTRVCPICDTFERNSPYALIEAPQPSVHPFCRCTLVTTQPLQALDFTPYLPEGTMT